MRHLAHMLTNSHLQTTWTQLQSKPHALGCKRALWILTELGGSRTPLFWLRQLETISLNQQTPAYFHHTKGAMCTFSTLPANSRACVCVQFKNASALSSPISWFISFSPNYFFFPIRIFFRLFFLFLTDCSSGPDQYEGGGQAAARAWPSNGLPRLPVCLPLRLCCSFCLTLRLIIHSYLWARCCAGYELQG